MKNEPNANNTGNTGNTGKPTKFQLRIDVAALDAALEPLARQALSGGPKPDGRGLPNGTDLEVVESMLSQFIVTLLARLLVEDVNGATIDSSDVPHEAACMRARGIVLDVSKKLGYGGGLMFKVDAKRAAKIFQVKVHRTVNYRKALRSFRDRYDNEVMMSRLAGETFFGPKVLDSFICTAKYGNMYGVIVTELVHGKTLADWLDQNSSDKRRATVKDQIAARIKQMHEAGIFHNNLNDENIVVTTSKDPLQKIMFTDFEHATLSSSASKVADLGNEEQQHRDFSILRYMEYAKDGDLPKLRNDSRVSSDALVRDVILRAFASGVLAM